MEELKQQSRKINKKVGEMKERDEMKMRRADRDGIKVEINIAENRYYTMVMIFLIQINIARGYVV